MAVNPPARIAILGAGPIGLEAGLYARFLGYEVVIYERGRICENLLRWGHVRLFTPLGMNRSPLGLAALAAQDPDGSVLPGEQWITARELVANYFQPLAESDLLADCIQAHTEVLSIGREGAAKGDERSKKERRRTPFRILTRSVDGQEAVSQANVVIDCSGTYGHPNWLGRGGIPAIGERDAQELIEYGLPDVLDADRERYAGKHTLLVGGGYSAATSIVALARLAEQVPGTQVTWVTRGGREVPYPLSKEDADPLVERRLLAEEANRLAEGHGAIAYLPDTEVHAVRRQPERLEVELVGRHEKRVNVDAILAQVGYRPDVHLFEELRVRLSPIRQAPQRLANKLAVCVSEYEREREAQGARTLRTSEPNFYVLGSKSHGRDSHFLLVAGRQQIRELFSLLGGRKTLDLYNSISQQSLPRG